MPQLPGGGSSAPEVELGVTTPSEAAGFGKPKKRKAQPRDTVEGLAVRLAVVSSDAQDRLPSTLLAGVAMSPLSDKDLHKAARILARQYDLPATTLLRATGTKLNDFVDPWSGGRLTLSSFRRLMEPAEADIIERMLAATRTRAEVEKEAALEAAAASGARRRPSASAKRIGTYLDAITPVLGDDVDFGYALVIAKDLARSRTDVAVFNQNLAVTSTSGLAKTPSLSLVVAKRAADAGVAFEDPVDVAAFLHGIPRDVLLGRGAAGQVQAFARSMGKAEIEIQGQGVVTLDGLKELVEGIRDTHTSYVEEADRIFAEMEADTAPGVVEKVFGATWRGIDRAFNAGVRLADPANWLRAFAKDYGADYNVVEAFDDAWDILIGHNTLYESEWAELNGVDPVDTFVIGFMLSAGATGLAKAGVQAAAAGSKVAGASLVIGGAALDPLGAGLSLAGRAGKVLPFLSQEGRENVVRNFLTGKQARLGGKDVAEYLVATADETGDSALMYTRATKKFKASFGQPGIHPVVGRAIYDWNIGARELGLSAAERADGVRDFLGLSLGMTTPADSFAFGIRSVVDDRLAQANRNLSPMLAQTVMYDGRQIAMRHAQQVAALSDEATDLWNRTGPLMHEIPRATLLRGSLGQSDGAIPRWWRAFHQTDVPTRHGSNFVFMPDNDPLDAVNMFEKVLVRSRKFTESEMAQRRLAFARDIRPNNTSRVANMAATIEAADKEMLARIGKDYGMTGEAVRDLVDNLHGGRLPRPAPRQSFGALPAAVGRAEFDAPMRVSQLKRPYFMTDPMAARAAIAEYIGTLRQVRNGAMRAVRLTVPGAKPAIVPLRKLVGDVNRTFTKPLYGIWKRGVVAKVGYIQKVVLGDEMGRFLAVKGGMDRVRVSRAYTALARRRGVNTAEIELRTGLDSEAALKLKLPGLIERNDLANTGALRIATREASQLTRDIEEAISANWVTVVREDFKATPKKLDLDAAAWNRALTQFSVDEMGQVELALIRDGVDEATAINRLISWVHSPDGADYLAQMKQVHHTDEGVDLAIARGHEYLRYLAPNEVVAEAALEGTLTRGLLLQVPEEFQPLYVHGPEAINAGRIGGPIANFFDKFFASILEHPTNKLNRQPFYRLTKRDTYLALREQVTAMDVPMTKQLDDALNLEAERAAIRQTKAVMFDFARSSRMGELAWAVSPFLSPFLEFFQVWPKIVKNNPSSLVYAARLGKAANESGFIKVDESTGDLVVNMSGFAAAAPILAFVTGGKLGKDVGGGWDLSIPLSAFNIFAQNAFPFEHGDLKLPIPWAGFSPPAQFFAQQVVQRNVLNLDEPQQVKLLSWLTEFGEVNPANPIAVLPAYLRHLLVAAVPSWFEDITNSRVADFMEMQQAMGLPVDEEAARGQAQEFGFLRAAFSFLFLASPRIKFPTDDLEQEWRDLIDRLDGDVLAARKEWLGTWNTETMRYEGGLHPELDLITIAKTTWADEDNPFPLPATEFAQRILQSEGGRAFAQDYPEWAWAIIPSELRSGDLDFGVWFTQLQQGLRDQRTPEEFEQAAAIQQGWDAYFAGKEMWKAWQQAHPDQSDGDVAYDLRNSEWKGYQKELGEMNPQWLAAKGELDLRGLDPDVMRHARALVKSQEFLRTETGQWLRGYLELYDSISEQMSDANISSLYSSAGETVASAEALGIVQRYEARVAELNERYPDGEQAHRLFFSNAFTPADAVTTAGERYLRGIDPDLVEPITEWGDRMEILRPGPSAAGSLEEKDQAFLNIQEWVLNAFRTFPKEANPATAWYLTQSPLEKRESIISVIESSAQVFWSGSDRVILGLPTNAKAESAWLEFFRERANIRIAGIERPNYAVGENYDRLNRELLRAAKDVPALAKHIKAMNTWGYGLEHSIRRMEKEGLVDLTTSGEYWDAVFDAARQIQGVVDRQEMTGLGDFDRKARARYKKWQDMLKDYVDVLRNDEATFRAQWDDLEAATLDPLIYSLMPEDWFLIKGPDKDDE